MEIPHVLQSLGFNDKEIRVYLSLLTGGSSSVRKLANDTDLNRGTVYDILKSLQKLGVVGVYQKHKKQFFMAENPDKLIDVVEHRERTVSSLKRNLADLLPELRSLYAHGGRKPVVKYYEGAKGVNIILRDVLTTMSGHPGEKLYRVYSSVGIRQHLYREFADFTKQRVERRISVRAIAVGEGGDERPLSERRWLSLKEGAPTYSIIYGPKVAFFSLDDNTEPLGILIEDERVADTERMIFDHVWETLSIREPADMERIASVA
ncbi:hypothetical protein AMJ57_04515 [Parcubacteria bacterium SG8_24]|nr:MAG: hypothetical protein AMJ57_04515 [Parcubacteria bacterium SG8_24]